MKVFSRGFINLRAVRWGAALAASLMAAAVSLAPAGAAPPGAIITVNTLADVAPADDGSCTLREAIIAANTNSASGATVGECVAGLTGRDEIVITGTGTISPTADLPTITALVRIDGAGNVRVDGGGTLGNGFLFGAGSKGSVLTGLIVTSFTTGVRLAGGTATLTENWIGTPFTGFAAANDEGVRIELSGNKIGLPGQGNVISGNLTGIHVASGSKNTIQANSIGMEINGLAAQPNNEGIVVGAATSTLIGGSAAGQGNTISGNTTAGIKLTAQAKSTKITRNGIGPGPDMDANYGNGKGILDLGSQGTTIGGKMTTAGNFIVGNLGGGIVLAGGTPGGKVTITGNIMGRNGSGGYVGNISDGIRIEAAYSKLSITNNNIGTHNIGINKLVTTTSPTVSGNCFFANNTGASNTGSLLKAAKNWWGHESGPKHPVTNPTAFGDPVTDDVLYIPFLTKEPASCSAYAAKLGNPKPFGFGPKSTSPTTFTWGKVPTASSYTIRLEGEDSGVIANDVDMGTQTKYTTPLALDYDEYEWTVTTDTADGVAWPSFGMTWVTIMKSPAHGTDATSTLINFTWLKFTNATSYTWRLYESNETDPPCTVVHTSAVINAPATSHSEDVGSGEFTWSVQPNNGPEMPCWFFDTP